HQIRDARGVQEVFVGALERIDWGERQSTKGFVSMDPTSMKWKFHELPTREMLQITVRLGVEDKDQTATILQKIQSDVDGKMVRLIIELALEMRHSVREERLGEKLARAFDFRFFWKTPSPEPVGRLDTGRGLPDHFKLLES